MYVSQKGKFIFLHPMKTGGTTMRSRLRRARIRNSGIHNPKYHSRMRALMEEKQIWHVYHLTWEPWILELEPELSSYHKFTFVRNPYDRFYSFYLQFWINIKSLIPEAKAVSDPEKFFKPVRFWYEHPNFRKGSIRYVNTPQVEYTHTLIPAGATGSQFGERQEGAQVTGSTGAQQGNWVRHADFIGRLECYEEDLERIAEKLGIADTLFRRAGRRKCNVRTHPSPEKQGFKYLHHFDQDALDYVNEHWAEDFALLGYRKVERVEEIPEAQGLCPYLTELHDFT